MEAIEWNCTNSKFFTALFTNEHTFFNCKINRNYSHILMNQSMRKYYELNFGQKYCERTEETLKELWKYSTLPCINHFCTSSFWSLAPSIGVIILTYIWCWYIMSSWSKYPQRIKRTTFWQCNEWLNDKSCIAFSIIFIHQFYQYLYNVFLLVPNNMNLIHSIFIMFLRQWINIRPTYFIFIL